jgi:hypothetical protein
MIKKIIIGLVLLGFAWSLPSVRERTALALAPALPFLGPVGERLQRPMLEYRAETDVKFIVDQLHMERTEGRALPKDTRAFNEWMGRKGGAGDRGKDPWGNLYWMKKSGGSTMIGSNGADGVENTADDIRRSAAL